MPKIEAKRAFMGARNCMAGVPDQAFGLNPFGIVLKRLPDSESPGSVLMRFPDSESPPEHGGVDPGGVGPS
jgi:hypothetical protein